MLRVVCWLLGPVLVALAHFALLGQAPMLRMLAICALLFYWMKLVVTVEYRAAGNPPVPLPRWLAWALLWPGMRPRLVVRRAVVPTGLGRLTLRSVLWLVLGAGLVGAARFAFVNTGEVWLATVPLVVGLSLVLHFGLFGLLCAGWRRAGFDLRPVFRAPLLATSLTDFWKRRWNVAFSEMCQEGVARGLSPLGPRMVAVSIFLFSGLLHEAAISLPVNAGYGGPMAYFAIHGCAAQIEPKLFRPGSAASRLWTALLVLAPLALLFHQPFLQGCVWPLIGAAP
ncbi:MAG: hypothetical protein KF754_12280 [Planctomycetes bacterium]|nr:hypothetical protein [Planctomycetota bacterium]